jgi:FkbM family methyltransferase
VRTDFPNLVRIRNQEIEGVKEWVWPIDDEGAWQGPSEDFVSIREAIRTKVKKRGLIVQAGGCCGMYPRLFADWFDRVVTFEPAPLNWYCLVKNCSSDKIIKYNAALGEYDGKTWLNIGDPHNVGTNSIASEGHGIEVQQMTVDSLKLDACDAIQFDLEGYEAAALLGAAKTISLYRPIISLETKQQHDASNVLLQEWGYKVYHTTRYDTQYMPINT